MELVKKESKDENALAQEEMVATIIETILPKIKPIIGPATERFGKFINAGNTIIIRSYNGEPFAFLIKDETIDEFSLKEGCEPELTLSLEQIVEKIISGNFSK